MSASGFTPISIYYSSTASNVPTAANLVPGELAINTNDGKLYYEDSAGVVQVLATKSTGSIGGSNTQVQFNNSGSLGGSSSFTWDGTTVTATKFAGALNGTVGATTASTGAFTTLSATGVATFSAGTVSLPAITTTGDTNTGIYFPAADTIAFTEGGAESMRINSSGNVFIGTATSSGERLRVETATNTYLSIIAGTTSVSQLWLGNTTDANIGLIGYDHSTNAMLFRTNSTERMRITSAGLVGIGTSSPTKALTVSTNTSTDGILITGSTNPRLQVVDTTNSVTLELISGDSQATIRTDTNHPLVFGANGTEWMTLSAVGNLLVGTTTGTGAQLRVHTAGTLCSFMQNSAAAPNGLQIYYSNATAPNNTASEFLYFSDTSALRMSVRSNGGIANYTANNVVLSDSREKINFAPSKSYLDVICAIPVQTFNYIDQNLETDAGLTLGVTAQDVQAVAPELVTEGNWGSKDQPKMRLEIYQTDLQYALMKAIQELKAEFDAYKATHP
jgi:hypothetical protein